MATWVITIDRNFPQHWGIAAKNRVWDYPASRKVRAGDELYFWQSGDTFVGRATAKADAFPLPDGASVPWEDNGERTYTTRVDLQWAEQLPPVKIQPGTTLADLKRKLNVSTGRPLEDRFAQALASTYGEPVNDPAGEPEDAEAVDLQQVLLSDGGDLRIGHG